MVQNRQEHRKYKKNMFSISVKEEKGLDKK